MQRSSRMQSRRRRPLWPRQDTLIFRSRSKINNTLKTSTKATEMCSSCQRHATYVTRWETYKCARQVFRSLRKSLSWHSYATTVVTETQRSKKEVVLAKKRRESLLRSIIPMTSPVTSSRAIPLNSRSKNLTSIWRPVQWAVCTQLSRDC